MKADCQMPLTQMNTIESNREPLKIKKSKPAKKQPATVYQQPLARPSQPVLAQSKFKVITALNQVIKLSKGNVQVKTPGKIVDKMKPEFKVQLSRSSETNPLQSKSFVQIPNQSGTMDIGGTSNESLPSANTVNKIMYSSSSLLKQQLQQQAQIIK